MGGTVSWFKVNEDKIRYTDTSKLGPDYTGKMDKVYAWMARIYSPFLFFFPTWKRWIRSVQPHIRGPRVLEVSFGNGYLMSQYASDPALSITGLDYNYKMVEATRNRLNKKHQNADLRQGNVEALPFSDRSFDSVINTMAFTGYPDGNRALSEIHRVLKNDGRFLLVDFDYPRDRNRWGYMLVRLWDKMGDIIKDIPAHLDRAGFNYEETLLGGFGTVRLFECWKK